MPRGGPRPGSGRKPEPKDGNVLAMPNRRAPALPPALDEGEKQGLLVVPAELSAGAAVVWARWASLAIAEKTLTPATAAGFRQFCQQWSYL